ncbi:MAG TPA: hypothetical protein VFU72_16360 [Nitrolancea sp.]|nr:hypothetical protein [Nitrolancea sp.]
MKNEELKPGLFVVKMTDKERRKKFRVDAEMIAALSGEPGSQSFAQLSEDSLRAITGRSDGQPVDLLQEGRIVAGGTTTSSRTSRVPARRPGGHR